MPKHWPCLTCAQGFWSNIAILALQGNGGHVHIGIALLHHVCAARQAQIPDAGSVNLIQQDI